MTVSVRLATVEDIDALAALLEEMDRFYGAEAVDPLDQRRQEIQRALFSETPAAQALLAWDGSQLVGFGTYSYLWPAVGLTRSLFLKELYVTEAARGYGVGRAIMRSLYDIALKQGCSRVEWMTDRPNMEAQAFYQHISVAPDTTKVFYRVQGDDALRRLLDM
jgi:GNAT superfamily N-acetyltransferase